MTVGTSLSLGFSSLAKQGNWMSQFPKFFLDPGGHGFMIQLRSHWLFRLAHCHGHSKCCQHQLYGSRSCVSGGGREGAAWFCVPGASYLFKIFIFFKI